MKRFTLAAGLLLLAGVAVAQNVGPDQRAHQGAPNLNNPRIKGDANISLTDKAQTWTKGQGVSAVALTDAATITVDASQSNVFTVTLAGSRTLGAPTNTIAGQTLIFEITQDGTGSRTLAYNAAYKFPGGTAPTLTTTAAARDDMSCVVVTAGGSPILDCVSNLNFH